jgi:hypothetical protein
MTTFRFGDFEWDEAKVLVYAERTGPEARFASFEGSPDGPG